MKPTNFPLQLQIGGLFKALCGANRAKITGFGQRLTTGSQDATHSRKEL